MLSNANNVHKSPTYTAQFKGDFEIHDLLKKSDFGPNPINSEQC